MAEQEACAQIVAATAEETSSGAERQSKGECPSVLPAPLVTEVHGALARLQGALRPGQGGHLLELVARLQAGLLSAGRVPNGAPPQRTFKKRDKKARHTVGVTKEELIDARKVVEDLNIPLQKETQDVKEKPANEIRRQSSPYTLQKQTSLGSVNIQDTNVTKIPQSPVKNATAQPFSYPLKKEDNEVVQNGPLTPSDDSISFHNALPVQQKQMPIKQTAYVEASPVITSASKPKPPFKESMSLDRGADSYDNDVAKLFQESLIKAAQKKTEVFSNPIMSPDASIESEDEQETMKVNVVLREKKPIQVETIKNTEPKTNGYLPSNRFSGSYKYLPQSNEFQVSKSSKEQNTPYDSKNSISKVKEIEEKLLNGFGNTELKEPVSKPTNRFSNKKIKMKRANTIDIPKPLHCYQVDSEDEDGRSKNSPEAFKKPKIPDFQPKTDNDHKFLAFIQKHNNNETGTLWAQNNPSGNQKGGCNWSSCFGSIKNVFESSTGENSRSSSVSSAKKFWKTSDDSSNFSKPSNFGPKLTKSGANYLNSLHENKSSKLPWTSDVKGEVITGSLMVAGPKMVNGSLPDRPLIKPIPKPAPVNQFSHAPMSAFKPLPKKTITSPVSTYVAPPVWSPPSVSGKVKKLTNADFNKIDKTDQIDNLMKNGIDNSNHLVTKPPTQKSPSGPGVPWGFSNTPKDNRVLNLATKKFESPPNNENPLHPLHIPPYKEKNFNPVNMQNGQISSTKRLSLPQALPAQGPLSAPRLVQNLENQTTKTQIDKKETEIEFPPKIDAERLQIEFYEKQIRESSKNKPLLEESVSAPRRFSEQIPSQEFNTYTVTDFTPPSPVSTFVPLPQIPDIEENKPRPQKKLPDLVLNNLNQDSTKQSPVVSPSKVNVNNLPEIPAKIKQEIKNDFNDVKDIKNVIDAKDINEIKQECENLTDSLSQTEYKAVTKVMKGPVSQQAVIKTNKSQDTYEKRDTAAKSLKGVLQKFSSPKHDVITQIEKKKNISNGNASYPTSNNISNNVMSNNNIIPNNVMKNNGVIETKINDSKISNMSKPRSQSILVKPNQITNSNVVYNNTSHIPSYNSSQNKRNNNNNYAIPTIKYNSATPGDVSNDKFRSPEGFKNYNQKHNYIQNNTRGQPYSLDSLEINANGESVISSKLQFPPPNTMAYMSPINSCNNSGSQTPSPTALSKSESWHQLTQQHAMKPPSPRISSPGSKIVSRAKSMHLLSVPKQFEAGITKEKINEKKKTVEAYFSGQLSPNQLTKSSSQHSIFDSFNEDHNRRSAFVPMTKQQFVPVTKQQYAPMVKQPTVPKAISENVQQHHQHRVLEKSSSQVQNFGLGRSRTMPQMTFAELALLDENNVEDAFDDLFKSS